MQASAATEKPSIRIRYNNINGKANSMHEAPRMCLPHTAQLASIYRDAPPLSADLRSSRQTAAAFHAIARRRFLCMLKLPSSSKLHRSGCAALVAPSLPDREVREPA